MSLKALVKHDEMRPKVIACLLLQCCGGLLVLYSAVLYMINLLNSLVGGVKKSLCDNAIPVLTAEGDKTAV